MPKSDSGRPAPHPAPANTPKEKILVVPTEKLWETTPRHQGFRSGAIDLWESLTPHCFFLDRAKAEPDPAYKQLIPYIVLKNAGRIFRYWRTKHAGESRLHHLYSIGVGGHIDERDDNLFTAGTELLIEAAEREIREEVNVNGALNIQYMGTLNDDATEVGSVHLGLVFVAECGESAEARESAIGRSEWLPPTALRDGVEYESWSQLLIDAGLADATAAENA